MGRHLDAWWGQTTPPPSPPPHGCRDTVSGFKAPHNAHSDMMLRAMKQICSFFCCKESSLPFPFPLLPGCANVGIAPKMSGCSPSCPLGNRGVHTWIWGAVQGEHRRGSRGWGCLPLPAGLTPGRRREARGRLSPMGIPGRGPRAGLPEAGRVAGVHHGVSPGMTAGGCRPSLL